MVRRLSQSLILAMLLGVGLSACSNKTPDEKYAEAVGLAQEGQTARAVLRMKEIVHDHPDDPIAVDASMNLAQYYLSERNVARALELVGGVADKLDPLDPRGQQATKLRLQILTQMGEYEKALAVLDGVATKLGDKDPATSRSVTIGKAQTLVAWGESAPELSAKTDEGLKILHDMMLAEPQDTMSDAAREQLANYYRARERYEESNKVYTEFLDKYPDTRLRDELLMAQACNLYQAGKVDEAKEMFEGPAAALLSRAEAELDKQARGSLLLSLANYHGAMGRFEEAEALMKRVMGENPMTPLAIKTQFEIAGMYIRGQKFERAREVLEQIKRENTGSAIGSDAEKAIESLNQMEDAMTSAADRATSGTVELKGS